MKIAARRDGHIKKEGISGNRYKLQRGKEYNITVSLGDYETETFTIHLTESTGTSSRVSDKENIIIIDSTNGYEYTFQRGNIGNIRINLKKYKKDENAISVFSGNCEYCSVKHNYVSKVINGDRVVIDNAAELMWYQSVSEKSEIRVDPKTWVSSLDYAGHSDWRLPTDEEAFSLFEHYKKINKMCIDPLFNLKQFRTCTNYTDEETNKVWCVHFKRPFNTSGGFVCSEETDANTPDNFFVRPVRSMK